MLQTLYSSIRKRKKVAAKEKRLKNYFAKERVSGAPIKMMAKESVTFKVSVISAVYNAEDDVDAFLYSLINQNISFEENIQVILIDDGSSDRTKALCDYWVSKYPKNIYYYYKDNGGVASARNLGIKKANHKWVAFIDPDDFVNGQYFARAAGLCQKAMEVHGRTPDLISCNMIIYNQDNKEVKDSHPLSYKFKRGEVLVSADEVPLECVQLSASSSIMDLDFIKKEAMSFKDVRPGFEDALFVNEYLIRKGGFLAISPKSKYFYRKRVNGGSLLATAWEKKEKYKNQLIDGNLRLAKLSNDIVGYIPEWVQYVLLYDAIWHFKYLLNQEQRVSFLRKSEVRHYKKLLRLVFKNIDEKTLWMFDKAGINDLYKVGITGTYYDESCKSEYVEIVSYDYKKEMAKVRYIAYSSKYGITPVANGSVKELLYPKEKINYFLGELFVRESFFWLEIERGEPVKFYDHSGQPLYVKIGRGVNNKKREYVYGYEAYNFFKPPKVNRKELELSKKIYTKAYELGVLSKKYKNSWLIMDRDTQADDNAEHFYEYMRHKKENIWFILRKSSHDWGRLKDKGFKLIEFGSIHHKLALLYANFFISSHADKFLLDLMPWRFYSDIIKFEYIFLQHGVTKDDLSTWLNSKNINLLVTATQDEFLSISGSGNKYVFSEKEVALTGFPRHDRLFKKNTERKNKRIVIMPTWRKGLVGKSKGNTNQREINTEFCKTNFFLEWDALLKSDVLAKLKNKGYEIVFFPHVNISPYINMFCSENVTVLRHEDVESIQDLFVSSDLLVTDYSSVAFEMAFLEKGVLYFQFDEQSIYNGGHLYAKGYFDYRKNGFGPVTTSLEELESELVKFVERGGTIGKDYISRMSGAFPYEKGRACERIYQEIIKRK